MYLLIVSYTQLPAKVEPHVPAHGAWVRQNIEEGNFLFAGPKKSGLGGVIGVKSMDKTSLRAILAADSYVRADVADYQVIEYENRLACKGLEALNVP